MRPCPIFANFTPAFALQLRKKHGKTSVRVAEVWQYTYDTVPKQPHFTKLHTHTSTHYKTHTHTHTHTHKYTLQNKIKPPQYKLKQTKTEQDTPKRNSHNINSYPQYKVTLISYGHGFIYTRHLLTLFLCRQMFVSGKCRTFYTVLFASLPYGTSRLRASTHLAAGIVNREIKGLSKYRGKTRPFVFVPFSRIQ